MLDAANESLKPLLIFLLHTAARVGEALQVERRDVDMKAGIVTLRKRVTKAKKAKRELPITKDLREMIMQCLTELSDDPHALLFDKTYDSYEGALQKCVEASWSKRHSSSRLPPDLDHVRSSVKHPAAGCDENQLSLRCRNLHALLPTNERVAPRQCGTLRSVLGTGYTCSTTSTRNTNCGGISQLRSRPISNPQTRSFFGRVFVFRPRVLVSIAFLFWLCVLVAQKRSDGDFWIEIVQNL